MMIILGFAKGAFGHFAVAVEGASGRELTQAVTDHVFANENFFVNFAIVDQEGITDKFRRNLTGPSPGFDGLFLAGGFLLIDLDDQLFVDVWSFF